MERFFRFFSFVKEFILIKYVYINRIKWYYLLVQENVYKKKGRYAYAKSGIYRLRNYGKTYGK